MYDEIPSTVIQQLINVLHNVADHYLILKLSITIFGGCCPEIV